MLLLFYQTIYILIYDQNNFTLIDWREDFSGNYKFGDIYYDLSKLFACLMLDYSNINIYSKTISIAENNYNFKKDIQFLSTKVAYTAQGLQNTKETPWSRDISDLLLSSLKAIIVADKLSNIKNIANSFSPLSSL